MKTSLYIFLLCFYSLSTLAQVRVGGGDGSDYDKPYGYPTELDTIDHPKVPKQNLKTEEDVKNFTHFIIGRMNKCYKHSNDLISRSDSVVSLYVKLLQLSLNKKPGGRCSSEMETLFKCLSNEQFYEVFKPVLLSPESRPYLLKRFNLNRLESSKMLKFFYELDHVCSSKQMECDETSGF